MSSRHLSPENDPSAIYSRPMKIKRHSVDSKGSTPPRIAEESIRLPGEHQRQLKCTLFIPCCETVFPGCFPLGHAYLNFSVTLSVISFTDPMSPPPPPLPPQTALSPIDEGVNQITVRAVIENHSPNHVSDDLPPPSGIFRIPSPERGSPARTQSPDRLSAILPNDRRSTRRKSVDEQTTVSEKHHQGS